MKRPAFLALFRRREPINPGRELARIRHANDRALIRKTAREMREAMGLPASSALADRP